MRALAAVALVLTAQAPQPAPPFALDLLGGGAVTSADLRGQVVVINYWATWCAPCRAELAELDAVARAHPGRVAVFAVLAERRPDPRLLARQVAAMRIPVATRLSAGAADYPLIRGGVPTTYVLDRTGARAFSRAGAFRPGEVAARLAPLVGG
jgi:cytochrome c biogenesis protein CcmG, thiol:disulfide interchange protein DsbE